VLGVKGKAGFALGDCLKPGGLDSGFVAFVSHPPGCVQSGSRMAAMPGSGLFNSGAMG